MSTVTRTKFHQHKHKTLFVPSEGYILVTPLTIQITFLLMCKFKNEDKVSSWLNTPRTQWDNLSARMMINHNRGKRVLEFITGNDNI